MARRSWAPVGAAWRWTFSRVRRPVLSQKTVAVKSATTTVAPAAKTEDS
jgi:hypothetical protein